MSRAWYLLSGADRLDRGFYIDGFGSSREMGSCVLDQDHLADKTCTQDRILGLGPLKHDDIVSGLLGLLAFGIHECPSLWQQAFNL